MVSPEDYNPYCTICQACGEEGCCSANICQQHVDGRYCDSYLRDLKFTYYNVKSFTEEMYKDEVKYKDAILLFEHLWDKNYDKFHTQLNNQVNDI